MQLYFTYYNLIWPYVSLKCQYERHQTLGFVKRMIIESFRRPRSFSIRAEIVQFVARIRRQRVHLRGSPDPTPNIFSHDAQISRKIISWVLRTKAISVIVVNRDFLN